MTIPSGGKIWKLGTIPVYLPPITAGAKGDEAFIGS